jgi:hypothetical protein
MKPLIFILLAFSCSMSGAQPKPFVPLEYEYPASVLKTPKTYVYKNASTSEFQYRDIRRTDKNGVVTITWKIYDASQVVDSCTEVNDKAVEHLLIANGRTFQGENLKDSLVEDGSRLGEKIQAVSFTINPSMVFSANIRSRFLKDTSIIWQGKTLPCLVIESMTKETIDNPQDSSQRKEDQSRALYYFGKGIGLVRYSSARKETVSVWELHEVKELL